MKARIYKPSRSTMQSARGKSKDWVLEYENDTPRKPEPLMGWVSSDDTNNQVKMRFKSEKDAIQFAKSKGLDYKVIKAQVRKTKPRNYGDNFKYIPPEE
ncbi:MAG: ETC complex I subunit [Bdellovibrionales bacterium]